MSELVLVIDDNEGVRTALSILFSVHELECVTAASVEEGLEKLDSQPVRLVVQDMNFSEDTTSGTEGIALFHEIRRRHPDLPVILLTAWTRLETAVDLVRAGAADYLAKPWDDDKLIATARNLLELGEANQERREAAAARQRDRERLENGYDLCGTVFESSAMRELITVAVRVAPSDVPILITGPNGAGKEKFADIVHANSSVGSGPFVKVNVGALPQELMEAELFGAEAGAYTGAQKTRIGRFEAAEGGTLFLDEIGNLSLDGQAKLLRVLPNRRIRTTRQQYDAQGDRSHRQRNQHRLERRSRKRRVSRRPLLPAQRHRDPGARSKRPSGRYPAARIPLSGPREAL